MIKLILSLVTKIPSPWLLGIGVTVLLGAGLTWNNYKNNLREEGTHICVQAINEQTVIDLEDALADAVKTNAELLLTASQVEQENVLARTRLEESNASLAGILQQMREQKNNDKEYAAWSDTPLPDGVAERLRSIDSGGNPHTSNENGN